MPGSMPGRKFIFPFFSFLTCVNRVIIIIITIPSPGGLRIPIYIWMSIFIYKVARGPVPVLKLEGLECRLDHVISGEQIKMETVSRLQWEWVFRSLVYPFAPSHDED